MFVPSRPSPSPRPGPVTTARESEPIAPLVNPAPAPPHRTVTKDGFAKVVNHALDAVAGTEYGADIAARRAATGELGSVSDLTIAGSDAESSSAVNPAIRDRALAAFNEILTMQT